MKTNPLLVTSVYYLSFILLGLISAAQGPSLPDLARLTTSTLAQVSLIFAFVSIGYLIGSFFSGLAYDLIPGHRLMAISLLVVAASTALVPLTGSLWLMLTAFFMLGLGQGIVDVGGNTLLLWLHREKVGPFMNGLHFFFGVGALIAPLILNQVRDATGDIHWLFWICALISLPLAIGLWLLPTPSAPVHSSVQEERSFPVLPVILLVILFVLYVGLELGFGNWIYSYALKLNLATDTTNAAYLTSAFWGAFTVGRLLGVWTASRMRSTTILFMDLAGCIISALVVVIWHDSATALWIGTLGLGLCMASIFPTVMMLANERIRITGTITGLFLVGSALGSATLPTAIGQVFEQTPQIMPIIILVGTIMMVLVLIYFLTLHPKKPNLA